MKNWIVKTEIFFLYEKLCFNDIVGSLCHLQFSTGLDTLKMWFNKNQLVFCTDRNIQGFGLIVVNQIDNAVIKITTILITGFINDILILPVLIFSSLVFYLDTMTSKVQGITIKSFKIFLLLGRSCTHRTHMMIWWVLEGRDGEGFQFQTGRKGRVWRQNLLNFNKCSVEFSCLFAVSRRPRYIIT